MADTVQFKTPSRKISRKQEPGVIRHRQKTQDQVFITVPEKSRENSLLRNSPSPKWDVDNEQDDPDPGEKPNIDQVKKSLYQRECTRLGITPVGSFLRSPTRTQLSIRHYSLGPEGARALAVPLMLDSTMTHLDLEGNGIGHEGLANMMEMLMEHCGLTHLNLKRNNLKSEGAVMIKQIVQANKLILSLNIAANNFVDRDGVVLAEMLKSDNHLKSLDLSDNQLSHITGKHLGEALAQNETLENLDLSWNQFREGGAAYIMDGIKDNINLKTLNLAFNSFGRGLCEKPYDSLSQTLLVNSCLNSIDVSNNRLSDIDFLMVAKSLKTNEVLTTLKIGHNPVNVKSSGLLLTSVVSNENSGIKLLDLADTPITAETLDEVKALEDRGVKVVHGLVHQKETDFNAELKSTRTEGGIESTDEEVLEGSEIFDSPLATGADVDGGSSDRPPDPQNVTSSNDKDVSPSELAVYVSGQDGTSETTSLGSDGQEVKEEPQSTGADQEGQGIAFNGEEVALAGEDVAFQGQDLASESQDSAGQGRLREIEANEDDAVNDLLVNEDAVENTDDAMKKPEEESKESKEESSSDNDLHNDENTEVGAAST